MDLPAEPANGQRNVSGKTFGSTVTYSCDAGYKLKGPSTVTCLATRQWNTSGEAVHCIGKSKYMYIAYYDDSNITELLKCLNYNCTILIMASNVTNE